MNVLSIMYLSLALIILFFIISVAYMLWDYSTRPTRFANKIKEIQEAGYKVVYQNQTIGTISYIKNGKRCQVSVYRGYNSHAKY